MVHFVAVTLLIASVILQVRWAMLARRDRAFPKEIKAHWYCGQWYLYLAKLKDVGQYVGKTLDPDEIESPADGRAAFNPFRTGHASDDTSNLVDGLIPAIRIGDRIGLYKQVGCKYRDHRFYDGAAWDDGYKIDMKFVRSMRAE